MARPLPEPVLFLDECLGTHDVAETLRAGGICAEVLLDHFPSGTRDEVWLPEVGKRAWVVLSKDKWIRRRKIEKEALTNARVAAFVLTSGDMTGTQMGRAFLLAYPRMRKILRDFVVPFIARVDASGRIHLLTDPRRRAAIRRKINPELTDLP